MREKVIIGIATYDGPGRSKSLQETLESLKGQADHIIVGTDNRLGDATKFKPFFATPYPLVDDPMKAEDYGMRTRYEGYFLTCDDDLIYPPDYVERMIEGIERYNREAVVSFHGKRVDKIGTPWYRFSGLRARCLGEVSGDMRIHVPGTGCMGWHSSTVRFIQEDFPEPNMADIWAAKKLQEAGVPCYVLAHDEGWIRHTKHIPMDDTLWRTNKANDDKTQYMTEVFNGVKWQSLS